MQLIVTIIIIVAASVWIAIRVAGMARGKNKSCCGCSGCRSGKGECHCTSGNHKLPDVEFGDDKIGQ